MTKVQWTRTAIAFMVISVLLAILASSLYFNPHIRFREVEVPKIKFVEKTITIPKITFVEETVAVNPIVASVAKSNDSPEFFDGDSCPPEEFPDGCSLDIGVNNNQIGLAFGWHLRWPPAGLDAGGNGCDLVVLRPGWYENLWFDDGRFETYNVPDRDQEGWIEVLATQRADEQAAHYACPAKDFADIPQWDSSLESPPATEPTATPTTVAPERRETGQEQTLRFEVGESVYGWRIVLDTGEVCDGGECYLPSAPSAGTVTSGVINPWPAEVEGVTPWEP